MQRDSEFFDFWLHSSFFMPLVKLITSDASSNIIMRSSGNRFSPFKISLFLKTKYLTNVWVWPRNSMQDSIVQIQLESQAKNQANNSLAVSGWKGRAQQLVTKHILLQKCYRWTTAMKPVINNKILQIKFWIKVVMGPGTWGPQRTHIPWPKDHPWAVLQVHVCLHPAYFPD